MNTQQLLRPLVVLLFMCTTALTVRAIPADPNLWHTITLTNGQTVQAQLIGDEWFSYYRDAQGNIYTLESSLPGVKRYAKRTTTEIVAKAKAANSRREADAHNVCAHPQPVLRKGMSKTQNHSNFDAFRGNKKGLIILVNFQDVQYTTTNPKAFYNKVANTLNFSEGNYKLSIRDYFRKQSYGRFDLQFDVIGPVTVSQDMVYYGEQQGETHDLRPAEMVKEAVELVQDSVRFADYDWDGNGEVDNVFILYAGYNQAEGAPTDAIWPHKWSLSSGTGSALTLQGMRINTYACSSEMRGKSGSTNCGIGTFCHEFSHCMGFPDLYDTSYSGNIGVGSWDLMGSGSYKENGFNPMDYSGFEKWTAGWLEPIVLTDPVQVKNMKPIESNGELYVIDCESTTGEEYYILENRNVSRMYAYNANPKGLLITHIDYNYYAWAYNRVNTYGTYYEYNYTTRQWEEKQNNHMRWQIMPADNNMQSYQGQAGDVYPYDTNNAFTDTSTPKMTRYNGGDDATDFANHGITNITLNSDGTINFTYRNAAASATTYQSLYLDERNESEMTYAAGTYNVNTNVMFPNGHWRALWLPFDMTQSELQEALGADVKVAEFTNTYQNTATGKTEINFKTVNTGIKAFRPCIVKVNNRNWEYTELGLLMQKQVKASTGVAVVTIDEFTFGGRKYAAQLTLKNPTTNIYGYHFYETMPNYLPVSDYFYAYDCLLATRKTDKIQYTFDKVVTAIDGVETDVEGINTHNVYDMKGNIVRRNAKNTDGLPKGIYIFQGRKVVVE